MYNSHTQLDFEQVDIDPQASGNCVAQAIHLATNIPYLEICQVIKEFGAKERKSKYQKHTSKSSARTGVYKPTTRKIMEHLGWTWTPTMGIGTGCQVHLRRDELPLGRLVVSVSRHITCVIDHVILDTYNPDRGGTRCIYGYWMEPCNSEYRI